MTLKETDLASRDGGLNFRMNVPYSIEEVQSGFDGILLEKGPLLQQGYFIGKPDFHLILSANWRGGKLIAAISINAPDAQNHISNNPIADEGAGRAGFDVQVNGAVLDAGKLTHRVKLVVATVKRLVFHDNISDGRREALENAPVHRTVEIDFIAPIREVKFVGSFASGDTVSYTHLTLPTIYSV